MTARTLVPLLLLLLACSSARSMPIAARPDTTIADPDKALILAREKAFAGDHAFATQLCRDILAAYPFYADVRILLGRIDAWDGKYDEAINEFQQVLRWDPENSDCIDALADAYLWSHRDAEAVAALEKALDHAPNNQDFLFRKARALKNLGRVDAALVALDQLQTINPSFAGLRELRGEMESTSMRNTVMVNYENDQFSKFFNPMHYAYLQWTRRTAIGNVLVRLDYAHKYAVDGLQWNLEGYPRIADAWYAYVSASYSGNDIFPRKRVGLEAYNSSVEGFEFSLGGRYFDLSTGTTMLYTGSVTWYTGQYLLLLRPFFVSQGSELERSASLTLRRYFQSPDDYLWVRVGAGVAPDERTIQLGGGTEGTVVFNLQSQVGEAGWQKTFGEIHAVVLTATYTRQQLSFSTGQYVRVLSLSLGYWVRL